jgi:predicted RNA-binding Zn-ribbon protein involved in translation (DUF1610 family)
MLLIWYEVCKIFINKNNCLINIKNLPFMIAIFISIFSWIIRLWLNCDENLEHNLLTKDLQISIFRCPKCGSYHTIKNGSTHNGKPKRKCKDCGRQFVINPSNKTVSDETKELIDRN